MSNGTNPANGKTSKLVLILYIAAGVLGALFIYMFIYAINYIRSSDVCCRKDPGYGTEEIERKPCVCRGSGC